MSVKMNLVIEKEGIITNRRQFYLLSFSQFLQFGIIGMFTPYIAIYFKGLGLDYGTISLIFAANMLGNIAQPVWGELSDQFNKRKIFLLIAAIMWTIATIIISLKSEFLIFLIFYGFASIFGSCFQPVSRSLISLMTSTSEETEYQSKFGVLMSVGYSIFAWTGGIIITFFGFEIIFITAALIALLSLSILFFIIQERSVEYKHPYPENDSSKKFFKSNLPKRRIINMFRRRIFIMIMICSFFGSLAFFLFVNFIPVFYMNSGGDLFLFSWVFIISFVLFIGISYLGEFFTKKKEKNKHIIIQDTVLESENSYLNKSRVIPFKLGPSEKLKKIFIIWSIAGFSLLCSLILIVPSALMIILLVYSLPTTPFFVTSMMALTAKVVHPEEKAVAIGIQGVFVYVGRTISVYIGGLLLDLGGFSLAIVIDLFLLAILLIIITFTFSMLNRAELENY